jgi:CheY-like chemotaxis protein
MIECVNRSVLVVDDHAEFRTLAGRLLSASGRRVVGATDSVAAAPAAAVRLTPSAVLVDVELPDGDGLALARELAGLPWRPSVVLTSINRDIATSGEARFAGARVLLLRPIFPAPPSATARRQIGREPAAATRVRRMWPPDPGTRFGDSVPRVSGFTACAVYRSRNANPGGARPTGPPGTRAPVLRRIRMDADEGPMGA